MECSPGCSVGAVLFRRLYLRKPALHLSDIVRKRVHPIIGWGISARAAICSTVLSGQAPKPLSGAPKARGLTAKARIERPWMLPRSDTV